jgi:hypothetical protein
MLVWRHIQRCMPKIMEHVGKPKIVFGRRTGSGKKLETFNVGYQIASSLA